jgi:glycosyltransferase involved in cell wall biosynthesis
MFGRRYLAGRAIDYASFYVASLVALFRLVRRGDVVIAKTDPPLISIIAMIVTRLKGAILINWLQDVFPEIASRLGINPLPQWMDAGLCRLRDYSLSSARTNVVLGVRMRNYLAQRIPHSRIEIIENWADGEAVKPMDSQASALRTRLGLQERFIVGYSGNLGRAHEFQTILGAAEQLRNDAGVVFLMIGGGAKMRELESAVSDRLLENFRFLPYQSREILADSLSCTDVHLTCLLPSLEGLIVPSKFYGILAAGRPVIFIGSPDGELARVITEANCGFAISTGDDAVLAAIVRRLKATPVLCDKLGEHARSLFTARYTRQVAVDKWLAVLRNARPELSLPIDGCTVSGVERVKVQSA